MSMLEYRDAVGEIRSTDDEKRQVVARVCSFNAAPDTYSTTWKSGVFSDSLRSQMPVVCWGHDQRNVVGSVIDYAEQPDGLDVTIQFANPDDVPQARAAYSLIKDGHIKGWSFGFLNGKTQPDPNHRGALQFTKADLYEVSPVVRPSVPGTRTISVRSAEGESREISEETLSAMIASQVAEAIAEGKRSVTVDVAEDGEITVADQKPGIDEDTVRSMIDAALAERVPESLTPEQVFAGCMERAATNAADGDWASARQELAAAAMFADDLATDETDDGGRSATQDEPTDEVAEGERATVSDQSSPEEEAVDLVEAETEAALALLNHRFAS